MLKLSVQLVTWNGAKYVPYLFHSLRKQTYTDWELSILDNNSQDETLETMKKELNNFPVQYHLTELKENTGFAGGHNRLFKEGDSGYVLLLNQDMYLRLDCLEKLAAFLDEHPNVAAVAPRLMKWDFGMLKADQRRGGEAQIDLPTQTGAEMLEKSFSGKVDAFGLKVFRNRRVVEQCTGFEWEEIHTSYTLKRCNSMTGRALSVFGVSGAFPMYRRSALREVAFGDGTFFDESYHSYKEDVDLAYRLVAGGYEAYVLLDMVAYHDRSAAGPKELVDSRAAANKEQQSPWVKYHSYKNHLMTLYKNEYWQNFLLDFFPILWYELKKFMWFLVFDRNVLRGLGELWRLRRDLKRKKIEIKAKREVSWREVRKWWVSH